MTIRLESLGAAGYGGLVTLTDWWDDKRLNEGKITAKDTWKKFSFWTFLGVGGVAIISNAMGWMRGFERWTEPMSHGFLYGLPGFVKGVIDAMNLPETAGRGANSAAVNQAQEVLARRQAAANQLAATKTQRSYQREFDTVAPYAF
jgi:hypothetical protein